MAEIGIKTIFILCLTLLNIIDIKKNFFIPITFYNPLKACFSNYKKLIKFSIFLIEKQFFNEFLKINGVQNGVQ